MKENFISSISVPPMVEVEREVVKARIGGNATLKCKSEAFPPSENFWTLTSHETISSGEETWVIMIVIMTVIVRRPAQGGDLGGGSAVSDPAEHHRGHQGGPEVLSVCGQEQQGRDEQEDQADG